MLIISLNHFQLENVIWALNTNKYYYFCYWRCFKFSDIFASFYFACCYFVDLLLLRSQIQIICMKSLCSSNNLPHCLFAYSLNSLKSQIFFHYLLRNWRFKINYSSRLLFASFGCVLYVEVIVGRVRINQLLSFSLHLF